MRAIERQKSRHCRNESDPLLGMYSMSMRGSFTGRPGSRSPKPGRHNSAPSNAPSPAPPPANGQHHRGGASSGEASSNGGYGSSSPAVDGGTNATMASPASTSSFQVIDEVQRKNDHRRRRETDESIKRANGSAQKTGTPPKKRTKKSRGGGYRVHRVSYTPHSRECPRSCVSLFLHTALNSSPALTTHNRNYSDLNVIFSMYGSAYPQVLPFVVANVLWTCLIYFLKGNGIVDLTFHSSVGHSFMGLLVSFLIVSRSQSECPYSWRVSLAQSSNSPSALTETILSLLRQVHEVQASPRRVLPGL